MRKNILTLLLAVSLSLSLTACGNSDAADSTTLSVAASSTPHAEILEQVKPILAEQGIDLQIHVYDDYVVPNTAVEEGEEVANYFQHLPYLESFNAEHDTHLVSVGGIHIEPMGIYAGKTSSLEDLPDGSVIAIPNDPTNEGRALLLLEAQGLITLAEDAGLEATPNDIVDDPKGLTFLTLDAAMLPKSIEEVDLSVINSNYALQAGLDPTSDALAIEDADSPYVNIVAVKEGSEEDPAVLALVEALQSDTIRTFIETTYGGAVVPAF